MCAAAVSLKLTASAPVVHELSSKLEPSGQGNDSENVLQ